MLRLKARFPKSRSLLHSALRTGRGWRRVALVVLAAGVLLVTYWSAQAAFELLFFRAESTETAVLLSWATAREINVQGYKILCKRQTEPESAYHVIGTRMATGGPDQGAAYTFDVTTDVNYGEQYCFRLEEETTDGLPGEKFDICGYGPGVTPTPAATVTPLTSETFLTPIVVTPLPNSSPAPTLITPTISGLPGDTPTPIGQSVLETPTQPFSPLETPGATATLFGEEAFDTATPPFTPTQPGSPLGNPPAGAAGFSEGAEGTPAFTPTSTAASSPVEAPTSTATPTPTPSPTLAAPTETATLVASGADGGIGQSADATPTQMYIVVTATLTPEAMAAAPSLTPLPTATPTPDMGLLSVLTPSAQNMMIMLLCLIFLSATGLGTLGLLTTILYFRSQSQRRSGADDFSRRR